MNCLGVPCVLYLADSSAYTSFIIKNCLGTKSWLYIFCWKAPLSKKAFMCRSKREGEERRKNVQRTVTFILLRRLSMYSIIPINCLPRNKCSVGSETSIPEIEKLKVQLPFPREDFPFPRSGMSDLSTIILTTVRSWKRKVLSQKRKLGL